MTNQEIADQFRNRIKGFNKDVPLDYYDRFVDIAIYFNETIPEGADTSEPIRMLEETMIKFYVVRDNVAEVKEEVNAESN